MKDSFIFKFFQPEAGKMAPELSQEHFEFSDFGINMF
jgi:hypothetical protein